MFSLCYLGKKVYCAGCPWCHPLWPWCSLRAGQRNLYFLVLCLRPHLVRRWSVQILNQFPQVSFVYFVMWLFEAFVFVIKTVILLSKLAKHCHFVAKLIVLLRKIVILLVDGFVLSLSLSFSCQSCCIFRKIVILFVGVVVLLSVPGADWHNCH